MSELGSSLGGRSINIVRWGEGPKKVLLWSRMHGDESTATLALCDLFSFLAESRQERPWVAEMMRQITIAAIPMLNPDGAQAMTRHNAMHIDVNRDARALVSAAKARCSDAGMLVGYEGVQLHGGIGMTDEHDIGFYLKRARGNEITFRDAAFHAQQIVGPLQLSKTDGCRDVGHAVVVADNVVPVRAIRREPLSL